MSLLAHYFMPGLHVEDHAVDVPLDWTGQEPGSGFSGPSIRLFYRVLTAPEHVHDDLPLLVFLQGGPGGSCPRPATLGEEAWIREAVKRFRVVLPDQRGTGRSTPIDSCTMGGFADDRARAEYLTRFLAGSIVRDAEHLRRTEFASAPWVTLGQSYGGFLTLSYLSLYPQGVAASLVTGGIPYPAGDADDVYRHTFPRMAAKTREFYARYPQDAERVAAIADRLADGDVLLPNGDPFSVNRLQMLGADFGMKPSFERVHWLLDTAFADGDGSRPSRLSEGFLMGARAATQTYRKPLYWTLQEFIYASGECGPIRWAAQREYDRRAEFATSARPLLFTGEASLRWMFEECHELVPFRGAVELLMERGSWERVYDLERLTGNEVPLEAAVYYDDMYVDSGLQLETLARIGNAHAWITNEYEHDGIHYGTVFRHILDDLIARGGLERVL